MKRQTKIQYADLFLVFTLFVLAVFAAAWLAEGSVS